MEKPIAVVDASGGPRAAVRVMRELQAVGRVRGHPRPPAARRRARRAAPPRPYATARTTSTGVIDDDVQPVDPDTAVAELFTRAPESPFPVPVADADGDGCSA